VLLTSPYAVDEVLRNLPSTRLADLQALLETVSLFSAPALKETPLPPGLTLPAKDVPIFQAAALAGSTHLLTGDKRHFGPYYGSRFDGVLILSPRAYLESRRTS
jgi:hypothetical protein